MGFLTGLLMVLLLLTALFLIVLVLIQRGKGGGLAGAFGGMGGQSAFGTKAGDLFTKITIGVASFWIILCIITVKVLGIAGSDGPLGEMGAGAGPNPPQQSAPAAPDKQATPDKQTAPAKETSPAKADAPAPAAKTPAAKAPAKENGKS